MQIAVLMGGLLYDSQRTMLEGISDYAKKKGVNLFTFTCGGDIYTTSDHNTGEFQIYNLPNLQSYDAVIIAPDTIQDEKVVKRLEEQLLATKVPSISIDTKIADLCCYEIDNGSAVYHMTEHIVTEHGKSKILYLSGPRENQESKERKRGFLKCMEEHKFKEGKEYVVEYGNYWMDSGREAIKSRIQEGKLPEAVICANDYMAIGVVEELKQSGYRVPQDVIVTGFDYSFEGRHHVPQISSIKKPIYDMGYAACKQLVEQRGVDEGKIFDVIYKFSESCGCASGRKENLKDYKLQMAKEKSENIEWAKILNAMSVDLNEVNSLQEFIEKLKLYVKQMQFPYFYLCLCDEKQLVGEIELTDGRYQMSDTDYADYPEEMRVAIAYEGGEFFPPEIIKTRKLLPQRFYDKAKGVTSIVLPIHFRLHCMGYCVVGNSRFPMETIQFQSWIMNLGNGLENIRKQMLMKSMIGQLNKMWLYDTMTGALNRAGFYSKAEGVIESCKKNGHPILLLFVDIDHLKKVNDLYGHSEGDFYIKSVARVCQEVCDRDGIVMRYGGDEFVILQEQNDISGKTLIGQIKQRIYEIRETEGKSYEMDASVGSYCSVINEGFNIETLVAQADKEMYLMKKGNR